MLFSTLMIGRLWTYFFFDLLYFSSFKLFYTGMEWKGSVLLVSRGIGFVNWRSMNMWILFKISCVASNSFLKLCVIFYMFTLYFGFWLQFIDVCFFFLRKWCNPTNCIYIYHQYSASGCEQRFMKGILFHQHLHKTNIIEYRAYLKIDGIDWNSRNWKSCSNRFFTV